MEKTSHDPQHDNMTKEYRQLSMLATTMMASTHTREPEQLLSLITQTRGRGEIARFQNTRIMSNDIRSLYYDPRLNWTVHVCKS